METTEFSETSVSKNLTPGKYPKESNLHVQHGESLKTPCRPVLGLLYFLQYGAVLQNKQFILLISGFYIVTDIVL
jgi:hypothetical protein